MSTPALRLKARAGKPAEVTGPLVALFVVILVLGLILFLAPPVAVGLFAQALGAPAWFAFLITVAAVLGWGWLLARFAKR